MRFFFVYFFYFLGFVFGGVVEVTPGIVPGLIVNLRYSTDENFVGKVLTGEQRVFLHEDTVKALQRASGFLLKKGYRLVLWDAWRSEVVQGRLWEAYPDSKYLVPPWRVSRHRRGTSVDVGLADRKGSLLEMPSGFDEFTLRADHDFSDISVEAGRNGRVLREAMSKAGFLGVWSEWWHYDLVGWERYPVWRGPVD